MQQQLESQEEILERLKAHNDTEWKDMVFGLRLVAANYLDISGGPIRKPVLTDGRFVPVLKRGWEEGRHNPAQINTQLQVKSLAFQRPELRWENCKGANPEITAEVRRGYYDHLWDELGLMRMYQAKLLDLIICGEGTFQAGVRNGGVFGEYADSLDVTWDRSDSLGIDRRFFFRDRHMPISKAMLEYPELEKLEAWRPGQKGSERIVTITFYCSKSTRAILYKGKFLVAPHANPFGMIPARMSVLFQELSVRHATGQLETQLGPGKLFMRMMRKIRDVTLRGAPIGIAYGLEDRDVDAIVAGREGTVVKAKQANGSFAWTAGPEISKTDVELVNLLQQHLGEASGVNDFMRGRTDTKVDFATQLSLLASQSGITGQYAAGVFEEGLKQDAELLMIVGERFQNPDIEITVGGKTQQFDALVPINPLLGDDGDIYLKPGGTAYRSPMQKLQETAMLANVLGMAKQLPAGIVPRFLELALTSFEIDDKDAWLDAYAQAEQQQMMMQQMAQGAAPEDFGAMPQGANPVQGQLAAS